MSPRLLINAKNLNVIFSDRWKNNIFDKSAVEESVTNLNKFNGLKNVTISIHNGERVGLLGKNGSGKSTLLRTIAGVYVPFSGKLEVNGRISTLYDYSLGMDADVNGYQNIRLLMAVRGISLSKYQEVVADVEKFTELGNALAKPVKTYSAGMKLRIAFAIATFDVPEILLLDEMIGVGDKNFRIKAQARLMEFMSEAGAVIVASHSNNVLRQHCTRGLVLGGGEIVFDGIIEDAIRFHEEHI